MKIICRCANVTEDDVWKFREMYPNMPIDQMKRALKIGQACGCCNDRDCPVIDDKFEDLMMEVDYDEGMNDLTYYE